jgi:hypothetical protein
MRTFTEWRLQNVMQYTDDFTCSTIITFSFEEQGVGLWQKLLWHSCFTYIIPTAWHSCFTNIIPTGINVSHIHCSHWNSCFTYNYYTPAMKLAGYTGTSLSVCPSVCRHKFVPPTHLRFMHGFWWNFAHVIHDMMLCLQECHYGLLFFSRVMALDISKWKIVHVHYSLSLKWLVFCINMYFRIL